MVHDAQTAMRKRSNKRRRKGRKQLPRMTQLPDVIQVHLLSHLDTDASVFIHLCLGVPQDRWVRVWWS